MHGDLGRGSQVAGRRQAGATGQPGRGGHGHRLLRGGGSGSLADADPSARLYDNDSKARLLAELADLLAPSDGRPSPTLSGVEAGLDDGVVTGTDIGRTRAFVKIQDGCSFHCTYCVIPMARGAERSIDPATVVAEVRSAVTAGHREVVLTGINAGAYDAGGIGLSGLVRRILAETSVERVRLSSIEPQHLTGELLEIWAGSAGRCLPHFHVPLQSGDDTILRRMGRRYTTADYAALVGRVRAALPGVAVHADLIVGFPGEDDAAWSGAGPFSSASTSPGSTCSGTRPGRERRRLGW